MMKAARQSMLVASQPPKKMPSAEPMGMPKEKMASARERCRDRRQPQPAAELDRAPSRQRPPRDHARQRQRARPQLGPVGDELLVREILLVEECFAVARREQQHLTIGECDHMLSEVATGGLHFFGRSD